MSERQIVKHRQSKLREQDYSCYYCHFPIWETDPIEFARHHGITRKEASLFQCTAEHVKAVKDGGTSRKDNIVAACWFCNQHRHQRGKDLDAACYAKLVTRRLMRGAWHHRHLHQRMLDRT
jgi:hypothetical protein